MLHKSFSITLLALLVGTLAAAEPLIVRSLERLAAAPPVSADSFDFIVSGDTHSNDALAIQTDVFKQMIREWNALKPAFVAHVGDIVLGGAAKGLPPQWALFDETIAPLEPPFVAAPGGHDISDAASLPFWNEHMGPDHYAFSYGNSRFIFINTEEVNALEQISDEQMAWFKNELATTDAKNIFVFQHQPYFEDYNDPRLDDATWARRWQPMADAMHGHPVRVVFAGHDHGYRYFGEHDGVRYVSAAGGGYYSRPNVSEGDFNFYLLVQVRGEDVHWAVVKQGAVLPADAVMRSKTIETYNIKHGLVRLDDVEAPVGEGCDRDVTVRIENPYDAPFSSVFQWKAAPGWKISPMKRSYRLEAHGAVELLFHAKAETAGFPVPSYATRYATSSSGEAVAVQGGLPLVPVTNALRAAGPVTLDGSLDEWANATPMPLAFPAGKRAPKDFSGVCKAMWSPEALYIAFDIADDDQVQLYGGDIVWLADDIEFGVDAWAWSYSLTEEGPQVFLYEGIDRSFETVSTEAQLAVRRAEGHTIYEGAFPPALVKPMALEAGASFHFRVEASDLDSSRPKKALSLTPAGLGGKGFKVVLGE